MGSIPTLSILRGEVFPYCEETFQIHKIFEACAKNAPDKTAVMYPAVSTIKTLSYGELDSESNRIARAIVRRIHMIGSEANQDGDHIIAVSMQPNDSLIVSLLAALKAGGAYLPIDPSFPEDRVRHILQEASPTLVISDDDSPLAEVFREYKKVAFFKKLSSENKDVSTKQISASESLTQGRPKLAIVLYTSGSTGVPKGVRLPHQVVMNRLQWQWRQLPYGKDEHTCVFKTALTFVDSVPEIWGSLLQGRSVLVVAKAVTQNPEMLVKMLDDYEIRRLTLVPSLLRSILMYLSLETNDRDLPLRQLRTWISSGEPLPVGLALEFFDYFPMGSHVLCNFYGSTEVMGDVTYHIIRSPTDVSDFDKIPIGCPLDNTCIYLLDQNLRPVPCGRVGELFVSGLNLADGYVKGRDPDRFISNPLSADSDHSRLYRTGDYARIDKGTLIYEGRTDSQIKVRGHRIDLSEVEKAMQSISSLQKAIVLCYKPGDIDQALLGYALMENNCELSENDLEEELRTKLAPYMVPQVIIIQTIPLLVNGKIDRQNLLRKYEDLKKNSVEDENIELDFTDVPNSLIKPCKALFDTVASVLGRNRKTRIGLSSNFYELGGNSLNSVYTVTKLRDLGYLISISDFVSSNSLGEILEKIRPDDKYNDPITGYITQFSKNNYVTQMLRDSHKSEVISMVTTSFFEKADLEQWLMPQIRREDYADLLNEIWQPLVQKGLSFVVRTEEGETIGVALNFDVQDEPEVEVTSKLSTIFEFLEYIEGPIRQNKLPQGKRQVLHSFMMATNESLSANQNVEVMEFMETEVLKVARTKGFAGIFTTNTSPLTQQLGTDVFDYDVLLDYQVNRFVASDGTRPFSKAPESQRAVVSWKAI